MTDDSHTSATDSRRSFVKKGALAAGTLALGATGSAAAQEGDGGTPTETATETGGGASEHEALVQTSGFHPRGRFAFVSGVIDWRPDVPNVADDVLASYNTYMIRWLNTNEIVPLWVSGEAAIGGYDGGIGHIPDDDASDQPEVFEMSRADGRDEGGEHLVEVVISEAPEDTRESVLATDSWWQTQQDGAGGTPTGSPTPTEGSGNETGS